MEYLKNCIACQSSNFSSLIKTKTMMHPSDEEFNFDGCQNCGLVFLNPRVPEKELGKYYTDFYLPYRGGKAWGKYEKFVASSQRKVDLKRVKTVAKHARSLENSTVLDVGCGKPTFLKALSQQYNCKCVGTDFSNEGWKNEMDEFSNLELLQGDIHKIENLPSPDVVTMWHYLEHDYDPPKTLQKILSIAKSTTKLIVEVPNYDSISRKKYGTHWAGFHTPRHTALYTPEAMQKMMEQNGWQVETAFAYGTLDAYTLNWMSEKEKENLDWSKSMESEFVGYVKGMIRFFPTMLLQKRKSLGFMTMVARPS